MERDSHAVKGGGTSLAKIATKEGVHNVHTLGFGFGCTGIGLGRIGDVFGGGLCFQGLAPGSSPTSGTVFSHVSRPFGSLTVWTMSTPCPGAVMTDGGQAVFVGGRSCGRGLHSL